MNDLHRHQKSVHGTNQRRSKDYKCFAVGCGKPEKIWPRLDNFKQHLQRMHAEEDMDALIASSEAWYLESGNQQTEAETASILRRSLTPSINSEPASFVPPQRLLGTQSEMGDYVQSHNLLRLNMAQVQQHQPTQFLSPTTPRRAGPSGPGNVAGPNRTPQNRNNRVAPYPSYHGTARPSARQPDPVLSPQSQQAQQARYQMRQPSQNQLEHVPRQQATPGDQYLDDPVIGNPSVNYQVNFVSGIPHPTRPFTFPYLPSEMQQDLRLQEDFVNDAMETDQYTTTHEVSLDQDALLTGMDTGSDAHSSYSPSCLQQTDCVKVPSIVVSDARAPEESSHQISKHLMDSIQTFLLKHTSQREQESLLQNMPQIKQKMLHSLKSITSRGSASIDVATTADTELSANTDGKTCPATGKKWFTCDYPSCGKIKQRLSELKKHQKRHTRPYGCTFDKCRKSFGSKNDWKRHESHQHEQQECWRCDCTNRGSGKLCARVFWTDRKFFKEHLQKDHGFTEPAKIDVKLKGRRIPKRNQGRFWCGFCNEIVHMIAKDGGPAAENERLNHINTHLDKGMTIGQWIELGACGKNKDQFADEHGNTEDSKASNSQEEEHQDKQEDDQSPETQLTSTSGPTSGSSSPEVEQLQSARTSGLQNTHMRRSSGTGMQTLRETKAIQRGQPQLPEQYLLAQQSVPHAHRGPRSQASGANDEEEQFAQYAICCQCKNEKLLALGSQCWNCDHDTLSCRACKKRINLKARDFQG